MMQPPPRSPTHLAMLGRFVVEDEDRHDRSTTLYRRGQRRLVSKPEITAEPEDDWNGRHYSLLSNL
jgi:hypothetical protein